MSKQRSTLSKGRHFTINSFNIVAVLATNSNDASTKSNVVSTLLLVWTGLNERRQYFISIFHQQIPAESVRIFIPYNRYEFIHWSLIVDLIVDGVRGIGRIITHHGYLYRCALYTGWAKTLHTHFFNLMVLIS